MRFLDTEIEGVKIIALDRKTDIRGAFTKIFHNDEYGEEGLDFQLKEMYFSKSNKNVIRGMHFQLPPHDHAKIVFCPEGRIVDVVLDLRKQSATYGKYIEQELSARYDYAMYIPPGCAHGFEALSDNSLTAYLVSSVYQPESDAGILFNSFGKRWSTDKPILSDRDLSFKNLEEFDSPF